MLVLSLRVISSYIINHTKLRRDYGKLKKSFQIKTLWIQTAQFINLLHIFLSQQGSIKVNWPISHIWEIFSYLKPSVILLGKLSGISPHTTFLSCNFILFSWGLKIMTTMRCQLFSQLPKPQCRILKPQRSSTCLKKGIRWNLRLVHLLQC